MKHINLDEFNMWYQNASFQYVRDAVKDGKKLINVEFRVTVDKRFKVSRGKEVRYFDDRVEAIEFFEFLPSFDRAIL